MSQRRRSMAALAIVGAPVVVGGAAYAVSLLGGSGDDGPTGADSDNVVLPSRAAGTPR